ncbi:MAG: hypothetical protein A3D75_02565 [Candidatus Levybacteria bacterium RIFCSPHIGHO2_02_FULL_37_18]|nr:MAG: hypothetical protein A2770_03620 [Candidatus Levybacteria bacterium RIFCSPHIGHO2_01_FULL_38_12]OGH22106.1 MAG: hypothetical protein A3D75_02565 [Candidatus Levybacteria bacterium RIFCSPHIGHO2_02_FULL_37_18]OGH34124.1 MAG: hypothetical protein A3A47_03325 [Candidatus Levybacteria bacterium RIFCSPLOWO2_01_FULL_37_20]OGH44917.1 MAG: hypothetical protein A3J14_00990 [Candidatus Levybacteria bacterium RIFCSPLOWO2_02_FULL_37_18]
MAKEIDEYLDMAMDDPPHNGLEEIEEQVLRSSPIFLQRAVVNTSILTSDLESKVLVSLPRIVVPGIFYALPHTQIVMGQYKKVDTNVPDSPPNSSSTSSIISASQEDQTSMRLERIRQIVLEDIGIVPSELVRGEGFGLQTPVFHAPRKSTIPFTNLARRKTVFENIKRNAAGKKGPVVSGISDFWGMPTYDEPKQSASAVVIGLGVPPRRGSEKNIYLAKLFYLGLLAFFQQQYGHTELILINQTKTPEVVSEAFLFSPQGGGNISTQRPSYEDADFRVGRYYPKDSWDAYVFQLSSDGSISRADTEKSLPGFVDLASRCRMAGVVRIGNASGELDSAFGRWAQVKNNTFTTATIAEKWDVPKVLKAVLTKAGWKEAKK